MPDVLDPSGFQVSVVLRAGGDTFPLWMGGAIQDGSTIYQGEDASDVLYNDIPVVESVQIDIGMGLIGKITVEIATTYDLGLQLLQSSLFAIGSVLEVQIGYPRIGKFTPWFAAMAAKPSISINPDDGLTATLNCEGGAFAAARSASGRTYSGTYRSIIEEIASREENRWNLDIPTPGADDPLIVERGSVSQGNRTDWMFVQYICRMSNYDCWITSVDTGLNVLRLRRREDHMAGVPRRTFVCRGQCDFINSFPILTFESSAEGVWLPQGARQARSTDIDIRTRRGGDSDTVVRVEDTNVPVLPGDTTTGDGSEVSEGVVISVEASERDSRDGTRVVHPAHSPERTSEVLTSMVTERRQHGGLNATFSTIGIPDLYPGEAVKLVGLGIFNGNYVVESISHTAAPGDWSMSVKLLGDGVDARGMETALSRIRERYNQEPVEEEDEATGGGSTSVEPETPQ